jgi:hypothetical protein
MRINREALLKIAEDTVAQRVRTERGILSAYLGGSLLGDDFLLGGTADIDLTFIHLDEQPVEREVQRLTDEVHLDVAHYDQRAFRQSRSLRLHPWLGPTLFECKLLYDPQHFLDFTQASVRGQFNRPDNVLGRARAQAEHARQIWLGFASQAPEQPGPKDLAGYLRAIDHAANAVASLSGPPLTERRLLLNYPQRAEAVGRHGLYLALLGMLGAQHVDTDTLKSWLPEWQQAIEALPEEAAPPRLHACRLNYYRRAFDAMIAGEKPAAVLWPLLRTWTLAAGLLPTVAPVQSDWRKVCQHLGLLGEGFVERVEALDAFLDLVEDTLERWAHEFGG